MSLTVRRCRGFFDAKSPDIEDRGVPLRVYSVAKTVADLFKYRNKLGYPVAVQALQAALLTGSCSPEEVLRFAALCRVTKTVTPYVEVLMARRGADIQAALENRRRSSTTARFVGPSLVPASGRDLGAHCSDMSGVFRPEVPTCPNSDL